jgi:penicillin-binding protein 1B
MNWKHWLARLRLSWRVLRIAGLSLLLATAAYALYLDYSVTAQFEGKRFALPARVYARPLELYPGRKLTASELTQELALLDYKDGLAPDAVGRFERSGEDFTLAARAFTFWDGAQPAQQLRLRLRGGRVEQLMDAANDTPLKLARLDPLLIGGIYPAHNEDRNLVKLNEVPKVLIDALIATEDKRFYSHVGVDARAVARAAASVVARERVQGGSTLTQQLVKNFFLTPERTLTRKFREMLMAVLLELHYDKDEILETYLNEIYLGQDRNRAIHGFGLAAPFYFGKPLAELTLPEAALLVGMVKGPAYYDPHRHPERALTRRNLVLNELHQQRYISDEQYLGAKAAPLTVNDKPAIGTSAHPAFLDLVRRQLKRDYAESDLRSEGLHIFTTLDPIVQHSAERALALRLVELDRTRRNARQLEGAVVVTATQSGEVEAVVGGRRPRLEGFNRALDARRPVGSLLKPVIYLAALSRPLAYTLLSTIDDSPFVWKARGAKDWEPRNYDRTHHGRVPLPQALAQSYNVASARLGIDLGIREVLDTAQRLGLEGELPPYAASLLGAVDVAPIEMAQVYQTLASGGFRTPLRAIREVLTKDGKPLSRYSLSVEPVADPGAVYLLTTALQGVVREGTAQGLVKYVPAELNVAGKTGTTDELRDSWFAGFTGDRLAVTWVGYDDNTPAQLTGASGAMTVWGALMGSLANEPLVLPVPENIEIVAIDPQSGLRADRDCANVVELPFLRGSAPDEAAPCAKSTFKTIKNWFRRWFE